MKEEYVITFKSIVVDAEDEEEAKEKAFKEVQLGNLEIDEVDYY